VMERSVGKDAGVAEPTNSRIGICRIHDEIYKHVWHESKKTGRACFADICLNEECPNPINGQS
ncbi:22340_t:CDS:2, partial [Entrophospora sp. SA101]